MHRDFWDLCRFSRRYAVMQFGHWAASRKKAGSIFDEVILIFHWLNPSGRTVTEMSTMVISGIVGGGGGKGCWCVEFTTLPPSCADYLEVLRAWKTWGFEGLSRLRYLFTEHLDLPCVLSVWRVGIFLRVRIRGVKLAMYLADGSKLRMRGTNPLAHTSSCYGA
jgi:hypothetical protein